MPVSAAQGELFETSVSLPDGLVYRPQFITPEEERTLLAALSGVTLEQARYKEYTARRRIAAFGSAYDFSKNEVLPAPPLPPFLLSLRDKVAAWLDIPAGAFAHALISQYRMGTPLGWHRDTPNFDVIVGISLLAPCRMRFRRHPHEKGDHGVVELALEPRSAYVIEGEARWRWQHSVPPTKTLRYSITFRTRREHRAR